MSEPLAYHAVIHALEAKRGWTPMRRFVASIRHALDGHLPYQRYYDAGQARERQGTGEDTIERLIGEQFALDLNPITLASRQAWHPKKFMEAYAAYNASVNLGVRTSADVASDPRQRVAVIRRRVTLATSYDPDSCRLGSHCALEGNLKQILANARTKIRPELTRMSDVSQRLGLEHSVVHEASLALEAQGHIPIPRLAQELGCHQRTLERRLREDGLTAEMLRQVARLIRALDGIRSGDSLTVVAADAGFSDQAHMTRTFRAASGLPPSIFKELMTPAPVSG